VALIQGQTHSPHRAFFFLQECLPWACQERATLKAHQKSVSPHVSTLEEQFERSFGSIRARPERGWRRMDCILPLNLLTADGE
jgi:hypothetical protein